MPLLPMNASREVGKRRNSFVLRVTPRKRHPHMYTQIPSYATAFRFVAVVCPFAFGLARNFSKASLTSSA